jgi:hypothetical protein
MTAAERPDVTRILGQLKDFQRRTVDHAFNRLYAASDSSHRFLVADEVGLGKTLVAKGVIARAIDHLWDSVDRIDVIYVCSNADIARQNVNKLDVMGRGTFSKATRLTMLPLELSGLRKNRVNFVSFTPGTSFEMKAGTGQARERALLYRMLQQAWSLGSAAAPINVLSGYASSDRLLHEIRGLDDRKRYPHGIDSDLTKRFAEDLSLEATDAAKAGRVSLQERFDAQCSIIKRSNSRLTREQQSVRNGLLGELRQQLANVCVRALEPDLVILDEFQRFKDVLCGEGESAEIARELFGYSDERSAVRVMLLSATPYKMYTVKDEIGELDHYSDFIETLKFLQRDDTRTAATAGLLAELRRSIYRGPDGRAAIPQLRGQIESELRKVMARTERLAVSANRGGMLRDVPCSEVKLEERDVRAYAALQRVTKPLEQPDTVEFWKAAPYLLSFMEEYKLKKGVTSALEMDEVRGEVVDAVKKELRGGSGLTLARDHVEDQQPLSPPHPRLRWMLSDVVERGAWKLLWIPPSLPYYRLSGAYADPALRGFTKRLIFSAWKVAPKAIATLVSYEAERRMLSPARRTGERRSDQIERTKALLQFKRSDGRLSGMPVLGLMYPSITLAELGDTVTMTGEERDVASILREVEARLREPLELVLDEADRSKPVDEAWYWAAPILLDMRREGPSAREWFRDENLTQRWAGEAEVEEELVGWGLHVDEVRKLIAMGKFHAMGTPPADLVQVLARVAVAGPAVCALRALSRSREYAAALRSAPVRFAAAVTAQGFRTLFNLPEVISLLRADETREPYWLRTLSYSLDGCLQSVLDEYVHVAESWDGLAGRDPEVAAGQVAETMRQALGLRTSRLGMDDFRITPNGRVKMERSTMRTRFAMRFGDENSEEDGEANRKEQVRTAFNSPFWPFVLASTSVGQEGLDFHLYCHAIVHWNIPSNPVDMEQREGRVHRFKGHAVRRNVATRHRTELSNEQLTDPWDSLFMLAQRGRDTDESDLVPYWVYPLEGGAAIERHVPNLPLSRDASRYSALRRSLAVYRMVFGQPRQDDLLDYLQSQGGDSGAIKSEDLRIDLTP